MCIACLPSVTEAAILSRCLCAVTSVAKRLPVGLVPKEIFIALVRNDVVNALGYPLARATPSIARLSKEGL